MAYTPARCSCLRRPLSLPKARSTARHCHPLLQPRHAPSVHSTPATAGAKTHAVSRRTHLRALPGRIAPGTAPPRLPPGRRKAFNPVQRLADALDIPSSQAETVLASNLALGSRKPATLTRNLHSIAALLGIPLHDARRLAVRQPSILCYNPDSVAAKLDALAAALATTLPHAATLVAACPSLLCPSPTMLAANIGLLHTTLALTPPQLLRLLRRQPQLALQADTATATALPWLQELLALTSAAAQKLTLRCPQLLSTRPDTLHHKLTTLATLLSAPTAATAALCRKQPSLLCSSPDTLAVRHRALQALLRLPPAPTSALLRRNPELLLLHPSSLSRKLAALSTHLSLPAPTILHMIHRYPKLLTSATAPLAARLDHLAAALGLPPPDVAKMVNRHPPLARMAPATVGAKLDTIAAALQLPRSCAAKLARQQPTLLCLSIDTLQSRVADLAATLGVSEEAMARAAAQRPTLLTRSPHLLGQRMQGYAACLGVPQEGVGKLLAARPALLCMGVETLAARVAHADRLADGDGGGRAAPSVDQLLARAPKVEALVDAVVGALGLERSWVEAVVRARPALARQDHGRVVRRLRWLVQAAGSCPAWQQQWEGYGPATVGMLLTKRDALFDRLAVLARAGQQGRAAMSTVLSMGEEAFAARFRGPASPEPDAGTVPGTAAAAAQGDSLAAGVDHPLTSVDRGRAPAVDVTAAAEAIAREVGLERSRAEAVLRTRPALLLLQDREAVVRRLRWLVEAAGSCPAWRRQWEAYGPGTVAALLLKGDGVYLRLQALARAGRQGEVALSMVLMMGRQQFVDRFQSEGRPSVPTGAGAGAPNAVARSAVRRRSTRVDRAGSSGVARVAVAAEAVAALVGLERSWVEAVLRARPVLARQDHGRMVRRLRWLVEATGSCPSWQLQWEGYSPGTVAALLEKSDATYERLRHLVRSGQQGRVALCGVLMMGQERFARSFPGASAPQADAPAVACVDVM